MKRLLFSAFVVVAGALGACQQKGGPIKVGQIEPDQGITAGGDHVIIHGGGFVPGKTQVEVRFGRMRAEQVSIAAVDKISVVTPAGDKGPVDVVVMFDSGEQFKLPGGFKFVLPSTGDDVRKAFFSNKPGGAKAGGGTNTATTPPQPAK